MRQHGFDAPRLGLAGRDILGMLCDVTPNGFGRSARGCGEFMERERA